MGKIRDEFLQLHWTRYPEMPRESLARGRVQHLSVQHISLKQSPMAGAPVISASEVLRDGDIVAVLPDQSVLLLAPNLSDRSHGTWAQHKIWQEFLGLVRDFFKNKSFQEVKTPTLVTCPGTEPSIEVFKTEFRLESKRRTYFLPTSPELNLKKLLAEGAEKIFEIAPVFRNSELTLRHRPEFQMLEWYRAYSGLDAIRDDATQLISHLSEKLGCTAPDSVLSFSIAELFLQHLNFNLTPFTTAEELRTLAAKHGVDVSSAGCIDDYFYLIFMEKIEFRWPESALVFVEKYPPYQAALARVDSEGWAERFEIYWRGYELANAFHELNDPVLQRSRALEDLEKKKQSKKSEISLDENFFKALEFGLPPSGGIALGLERLYMVLHNVNDIAGINRIYGD